MGTPMPEILAQWRVEKIKKKFTFSPVERSFTIRAGINDKVFDSSEHSPKPTEGILTGMTAMFDHPKCGIRMETDSEFDTEDTYTIEKLTIGRLLYDTRTNVRIPPQTPAGLYLIQHSEDLYFAEWMRLYLINDDNIDHRCFGYGFNVALRV